MTVPLEPHIRDMLNYLAEATGTRVVGQTYGLDMLQIICNHYGLEHSFIISSDIDSIDPNALVERIRKRFFEYEDISTHPPSLSTRLARDLHDLERKRPTTQGLTPWQPYRLAQGALDGIDGLDQRPTAAQGADGIYARRAVAISRHAIRRMMGKTL